MRSICTSALLLALAACMHAQPPMTLHLGGSGWIGGAAGVFDMLANEYELLYLCAPVSAMDVCLQSCPVCSVLYTMCTTQAPSWCHANASDLVHWTNLSIALPAPAGHGSVVMINSTSAGVLFHSDPNTVSAAVSSDQHWAAWTELGPVLTAAQLPSGYSTLGDVGVWANGDPFHPSGTYGAVVSSTSDADGTAVFLVYNSTDFVHWSYVGVLTQDATLLGAAEFPQVIEMFNPAGDAKLVLLYSQPNGSAVWVVGDMNGGVFAASNNGTVDAGVLYGASAFTDAIGRIILQGVIREERPVAEAVAAGSDGAVSFARVVTLNSDDSLSFVGAQELTLLRQQATTCFDNPVQNGTDYPGGDYINYNITGQPNPLDYCRSLCCADSQCVVWAFVYSAPGPFNSCNTGDVCCYLKNSLVPASPNPIVYVRLLALLAAILLTLSLSSPPWQARHPPNCTLTDCRS